MKSPVRILAVDGGGVGGIIPARVLERLHASGLGVVDRADLVAGTSTGGLIALGLARGLAPEQLSQLYQQHAKDIFSKRNRRWLAFRLIGAKFVPDGLQTAVHAIVGDLTLGQLRAKHVFIPVTAVHRPDSSHYPAGVFLSTAYRLTQDDSLEKYASSNWKCVDVALATSAAPTYFPAHVVDGPRPGQQGKWVCWDGGVVANNPSLAAAGEILRLDLAERKIAVRSDQTVPPDIRVLSLGTGYRNQTIEAGDWGLIQTARPVVAALMDTSVGSSAFLLRQVLGVRAFRVSVPLEQDYALDDPAAVDRLNTEAIRFADHGLTAVKQPDGSMENLGDWLTRFWFD